MATVSSEVEKKCPLCAEEMDWTDQQLKPCKCGYEVCVWCWHHIMDMAEKDETEGRCPACRAPYDKEKIVGMQAKCERVVLKKDREIKPQKSKPKKPEEKKDLSNVRVIQRKMAYVIGLPLSLANEDILQQRDYFGQYGKVTKVSLSRTAGGAIQQFVNDSCSVYVTYSKEEEAVRCIQSVHGFLLEGRALRASFGTAKYCHAWLKNTVCNNAACLYLHTFGADEDSFGKDEEAAVHTRNRVHQIVGAARNMQWRSGSTLPPSLDEPEPLDSNDTDTDKINLNNWNIELTSSVLLNCSTSPKDQDERLKTPNRSFLDVVARPSTGPNQGNIAEDHNLLNICSNISTLVIDECCTDTEHSNDMSSKVSSTCPSPIAVLDKDSPYSTANSFREPECHHLPLPGKESQNPPKYSDSNVTEYSKEQSCLTSSNSSQNNLEEVHSDRSNGYAQNCIETSVVRRDINADSRNINIYSNQVSEPFSVFNSSSANGFQDKKMRSNSFSGEEIVGQLRKLDDNSLTTNIDSFALETVESNIVSSILSLDFDSCDDALSLPRNVTDMYGGSDERNGSLWNSTKSENSRFSFAKEDSYATNFSLFSDYMGKDSMKNDNLYSSGPQNNGLRTQSSAPPGFSLTIRDAAPPGFSSSEMTNQLHPPSSGSYMVNPVSYPNNHYSAIPNGHIRSASDFNYNNQHYPMSNGHTRSVSDMDFNDPAILAVQGGGKLTKGINHSGLNSWQTSATTQFPNSAPQFINSGPQYTNSDPQFTNSAPQFMNSAPQFMNSAPQFTNSAPQFTNSTPQFTNYDEEARLWLSTQQGGATQQGTNFAPTFLQDRPSFHQEQNYISNGDRFPYMGNSFGANSKIMTNQNQDYNSAYSQIPQQKYGNGHVPNGIYNIQEVQRNDRLGFDNLYSGHRDLVYQVPNTGDVYNRVYGL